MDNLLELDKLNDAENPIVKSAEIAIAQLNEHPRLYKTNPFLYNMFIDDIRNASSLSKRYSALTNWLWKV